MTYEIRGVDPARFRPLHALMDDDLAGHRARRMVADHSPGYPCRVSLEDAAPGEKVLLVHFEHHAVDSPFRSSHAIFVREAAHDAACFTGRLPPFLLTRLLSIRAFDRAGSMVDAEVTAGQDAEPILTRMLEGGAAYVHLHNARQGCFLAEARPAAR